MSPEGYPSETTLREVVSNPHFADFLEKDEPAPFQQEGWPYETIAYNLGPRDNRRGAICMDAVVHPIAKCDYAIIKVLGNYIDLALRGFSSYRFERPANQNYVIDNLLAHHYINSWQIAETLNAVGWGMFDMYACIAIESSSFDKSEKLLTAYVPRIEKLLDTNSCSIVDGHLVVIANLTDLQLGLTELNRLLEKALPKDLLVAGVSRSYDDFKDLFYYHRQAVRALHVATASGLSICTYEQIAVSDIVVRCRRDDPKEAMIPAGLKTLVEHDRTKRTEFVQLLRVYLESGLSATKAAQRMFIARNTCFYRLKRMQELSGIDLENPDERIPIELALRIMDQD